MADRPGDADGARRWVGAPLEVFRVLDTVYLDQARHDFSTYVWLTLVASQRCGGRFNPPAEFGALYTATDVDTAWVEVARRFQREGISGLPPAMGVLRLVVSAGWYADLTTEDGCRAWGVTVADLTASHPDDEQRESCWRVARAVRAVADALQSHSSWVSGTNMPLFPDRERGELALQLQSAERKLVPVEYAQRAWESW